MPSLAEVSRSARFTPSPWLAKGTPGGLLCVTDGDSRYVVDRFLLGARPPSEHEANALLISAAPDLFAACVALLRTRGSEDGDAIRAAHEGAIVAVSRACGLEDGPEEVRP
jgi:hypothetical protein